MRSLTPASASRRGRSRRYVLRNENDARTPRLRYNCRAFRRAGGRRNSAGRFRLAYQRHRFARPKRFRVDEGIALSGFGMEADVNKARDAGFSEHLTKPINFDRLEQAIRHLLESTS